MATTPTPRSNSQIFGDLLDVLLSRLGLTGIKPGSPVLSLLEAVAASDTRNSHDAYNLLVSISLDYAERQALDRIGAREQVPRPGATPAIGYVNFADTSFSKISTRVYSGLSAPIVGSDRVFVEDASSFPASGSVYLSRGTTRYEGPRAYTAKTQLGSYWRLDLSPGDETQNFHNWGESVVLAQGGLRVIPTGTTVQAQLGGAQAAVSYLTLASAGIPDGEVLVENVLVAAQRPGRSGDVAANAIRTVSGAPYPGAICYNPLPFSNGLDQMSDPEYRELIRDGIQARSRGTRLALEDGVRGATSTEEQKRISSATFVPGQGRGTLVIDDGTGYEERSAGVALEILQEEAQGGEKIFQVQAPLPITQAFLESSLSAPFTLVAGATLAVMVGGVLTQHSFSASEFLAISASTAYEVVSSINSNPDLGWRARTTNNGTRFAIFAKEPTNDDLLLEIPVGTDVNQWFGLSSVLSQTMGLYLNDRLLTKDGRRAEILSQTQSLWQPGSSPQTLILSIDGTPEQTWTITDADFVSAGTGYLTLASTNSLESWTAVLESVIPGVTVETGAGRLTLVSNRGRSDRASLEISGGTLVGTMQMFTVAEGLTSHGQDRDYEMNRSTGQIYLQSDLAAGDRLTIGTVAPRPFVEGSSLGVIDLSSGAKLWFVVDGQPELVETTLLPSMTVDVDEHVAVPAVTWGARVRTTASSGTPFSGVQAGDWAIFMDTNLDVSNRGAFRVARVLGGGVAFEVERDAAPTPDIAIPMSGGGIIFVRTPALVQLVDITPGATYTAASLVDEFNAQLRGAEAQVWNTDQLRIRTLGAGPDAGIAIVALDTDALLTGLEQDIQEADSQALPSATSLWSQTRTPTFIRYNLDSVSGLDLTLTPGPGSLAEILHWERPVTELDSAVAAGRWNSDTGFMSSIKKSSASVFTIRDTPPQPAVTDEFIYGTVPPALKGDEALTVVVDQDEDSLRFTPNLYRKVKPGSSTYGTVNVFVDVDNANASLAAAFGTDFRFLDFAVFGHARAKSHAEAGDTTKTVLWRSKTWGPNELKVRYLYPQAANANVVVEANPYVTTDPGVTHVEVRLGAGAARTGALLRATTRVGVTAQPLGGVTGLIYTLGYNITSASRTTGVTNATLGIATPGHTDHNLQTGDRVWIQSTNVNFSSGPKVITRINATNITYLEAAADIGATANIGTLSFDEAGEAKFGGSTIIVGDVSNWINTPITNAVYRQALKILVLGTQYLGVTSELTTGTVSVPTWHLLGNAANFSAYPLDATKNLVSTLAPAVNALTDSPMTAVAVGLAGVATGVVTAASYDEFATLNKGYTLTDGVNLVRSHTTPPDTLTNFTFTFKAAITASLASNSDWQNEDQRLVPYTARNIRDFLGSYATSGLASVAEVSVVGEDRNLQITSLTQGSEGCVQVQGGTANSASATVLSGATTVGTSLVLTVASDDAALFAGGQWVELINSQTLARPSVITGSTSLVSRDASGNCVLTGTPAYVAPVAPYVGLTWQFDPQGDMILIRWSGIGTYPGVPPGLTGLEEGHFVQILSMGTSPISSQNTGLFRVVRTDVANDGFWIENPNGQREIGTCQLIFATAESSILPGDQLVIGTTLWGADFQGTWTVESLDPLNLNGFKLAGTFTPFTGPQALGTDSSFVHVQEGTATKLWKKLLSISPDPDNAELAQLRLSTIAGAYWIGATPQTLVRSPDRLGFDANLHLGQDAYRHSLGLIAEAAKIVYGDRADPATYPGLAAANSIVDITGPVVKRLRLGFAVRLRTQYTPLEVLEAFRSAIADEVNRSPHGKPLALSRLVSVGERVPGIASVLPLIPTLSPGSDLIPCAVDEKLRILDLEQDIGVNLLGV